MAIVDAVLTVDSQARSDETVAVTDSKNPKEDSVKYSSLAAMIKNKFQKAVDKRRWDETRWLSAYRNYRGLYGPDVQFLESEKSRVFVKVTKTKVLAARAQIEDILFAANKFPIGVEQSPVPDGTIDAVHFDPKSPENQPGLQGGSGGPKQTSASIARPELMNLLGPIKKAIEPVIGKLKEGPGKTATSQTFEPAKEAARNMEKLIHDQLLESQADKHIRSLIFELCLFGHGVFRGPFAINKEYPKWSEDGAYEPLQKTTADVSFVSIWDSYPDPDARNIEECDYFIQRHRLSKTQMRQLKRRPQFRASSIDEAIEQGPNYIKQYWENTLEDYETHDAIDRYEVLEYWGILDAEIAKEAGLTIPKQYADWDQIQVNVWLCGSSVLRLVMNPFTPMRIPYNAVPYEVNPYSFFGVGVAENMEDSQLMMNGSMRQLIDNMVLSGNVVMDVDVNLLEPGQDLRVSAGKAFRRSGGAPGQAINFVNIPNVTQQCILAFDKFRQLADETTGMPSYSHGISGVMGTGRTASGMSMLMGAAKENIKAVVRNIDDYLLVPLGKAMFAFNMQFNFDPKYVGDVNVVAKGTESLMRNEIRSQKLLQVLQLSANPMDAPFVKRDYIWRELSASLDLEPDKVVNDPREAAIQAEVIKDLQQKMGVPPPSPPQGGAGAPPAGSGNPAGAAAVSDPTQTGGGNIQPGAAPEPGAAGFTGQQ